MTSKLIRDKIPELIIRSGEQPITHVANDAEYWEKLQEKLFEETDEFLQSLKLEELGDILDVIDAIIIHRKIDVKQLKKIREKKAKDRGSFDKRIVLDGLE